MCLSNTSFFPLMWYHHTCQPEWEVVFFVQQHILPGNGAQVGVKGLLVYTKPKQKHLTEPLL